MEGLWRARAEYKDGLRDVCEYAMRPGWPQRWVVERVISNKHRGKEPSPVINPTSQMEKQRNGTESRE